MNLRLLIASTSTVHGSEYLEYLENELTQHFDSVKEIIFIPFARPGGITHNAYTKIAETFFNRIGISVRGIHTIENKPKEISVAKGIFTGGGNSFVL